MSASKKYSLDRKADILVFDDDKDSRDALVNFIESLSDDLNVEESATEDEAINYLIDHATEYDLVVCDACPDRDNRPSRTILDVTREHYPRAKVIIITSKDRDGVWEAIYNADAFISSPEYYGRSDAPNTSSGERHGYWADLEATVIRLVQQVIAENRFQVPAFKIDIDKDTPIDFWPTIACVMTEILSQYHKIMMDRGEKFTKESLAKRIRLNTDSKLLIGDFRILKEMSKDGKRKVVRGRAVNAIVALIEDLSSKTISSNLPDNIRKKRGEQ